LTFSSIEGSGKAIDPVDDHTLVLRISKPAPYFLAALTHPTSDPGPETIVQSGGFTWLQQELCSAHGIGSGPFTCRSWDHSGHLTLLRNDRHYGGRPRLRQIDYAFYKDTETPFADWEVGKGDVVDWLSPWATPSDTLHEAKMLPGFHQRPMVGVDYLEPNWRWPPFDNLDVRIAFDAAIDPVALANLVQPGTVIPTDHYIVPGLPSYYPSLTTSWGATGNVGLHADLAATRRHIQAYVNAPNSPCHGTITTCPRVNLLPYGGWWAALQGLRTGPGPDVADSLSRLPNQYCR
jgi:ABC-type oligopeptide transport system substrate-binding subunit